MGLAQKRIIQEYQNSVFPSWKKQFDEVCGCEIPLEIRWETMQSDDYQAKEQYFVKTPASNFEELELHPSVPSIMIFSLPL